MIVSRPGLLTLSSALLWLPFPGTGTSPADTTPVATYTLSVSQIAARQARDDSVVAPGGSGRSLLLTHGSRAVRVIVFLHGFTDSPAQFEEVGRTMFHTGANVFIPRLPHHAERQQSVHVLSKIRASQLASFGDSVVDEAAGLGDTVIVVGLSAGGVIAGHIAQYRADVARVVLIAPAIAATYLDDDTGNGIVRAAARLPEVHRESASDTSDADYKKGINSRGLGQLLRLGSEVRSDAKKIPAKAGDIVFLLNESDRTVSTDAALDVARSWSKKGALVSAYVFPKSLNLPHNVMADSSHHGNPDVVNVVIEALGIGAKAPDSVRNVQLTCDSWRCSLDRLRKKL